MLRRQKHVLSKSSTPFGSERPSPEPLLKKRGVPSRTGGERILEMLGQCQNATLGGRHHLSALNLKFDSISDGGCTREEQIALSLKRHLFPHGGREPKAFWICFSRVRPPSEIKLNFKFKTLKRHLLSGI